MSQAAPPGRGIAACFARQGDRKCEREDREGRKRKKQLVQSGLLPTPRGQPETGLELRTNTPTKSRERLSESCISPADEARGPVSTEAERERFKRPLGTWEKKE